MGSDHVGLTLEDQEGFGQLGAALVRRDAERVVRR